MSKICKKITLFVILYKDIHISKPLQNLINIFTIALFCLYVMNISVIPSMNLIDKLEHDFFRRKIPT